MYGIRMEVYMQYETSFNKVEPHRRVCNGTGIEEGENALSKEEMLHTRGGPKVIYMKDYMSLMEPWETI